MKYNRLIRDKIPEIMTVEGERANVQVLSTEAFRIALVEKLNETVLEYGSDPTAEGLVDMLEIIYAIAETKFHLSQEELEDLRLQIQGERGAFTKHLLLVEATPQ
jgi:predicted house-cleaning noncanonical NTP pyrophosphatase (MazG superfamily)